MAINKYYALCSNEILKIISSLAGIDCEVSLCSNNYSELFVQFNSVNYLWPLISTSLLMSENLYKYDKAYKLISDDTVQLIEDKLYMYPVVQTDKNAVIPCLLDEKNNNVSCFLTFINCDFSQVGYQSDPSYGKYILPEELQYDLAVDDLKATLESLRKDSLYGCNEAIIEDGVINVRKFIERTRNALAHSNFEVIDENYIRLYHYNMSTKKLDFNVILESSIIILIVDELNEIASDKYSYFMNFYYNPFDSELLDGDITDKSIIDYMLSFDMFDEDVALSILNELKSNAEFLNVSIEEKVIIINRTIYERIKPVYDIGIIINDYLYCDDNGKITSDELYDKYGVFNYLNSEYYNTSEGNFNDTVYIQNKFKFLLLAFLNCSLLNSYNVTEGNDIGIIDFSKMDIDESILQQFLEKQELKTNTLIELMEQELEKNKRDLETKSRSVAQKKDILVKYSIDNEYFNVVLPTQIKQMEEEKVKLSSSNITLGLELVKAKEQGTRYNFDKNISQFIFNHLRNSLAHGYVKFPEDINLETINEMIITFEDYEPDNKKELTFRGSIKLGDLLKIITSNEYVSNILGIIPVKNGSSLVIK